MKMSCLQVSPFNRGNTWDHAGCRMFFSGLISMYIFDILNIPSGYNHICSGCKQSPSYGPAARVRFNNGFGYYINVLAPARRAPKRTE
jgi:hypothetical protein